MKGRTWIAVGALWAAIGVACGAFGAHALEARLEQAGQLQNWEVAVRYQVWHALALIAYGICRERFFLGSVPGWCFLLGSVLFSGSIYCLAFEWQADYVWPLTPAGGGFMILGWLAFAGSVWITPPSGTER